VEKIGFWWGQGANKSSKPKAKKNAIKILNLTSLVLITQAPLTKSKILHIKLK